MAACVSPDPSAPPRLSPARGCPELCVGHRRARRLAGLAGLRCHARGPHPPSCSLLLLVCVPREDLGFRFISEQVSHHPPISAFYSEGLRQDFLFHGSIYPKLKFWGKSVEAEPRGTITLELLK